MQAAVVTWTGDIDTDYHTGGNWSTGAVPNLTTGDTDAYIGGTAVYTPGGDLAIHGGSTLTVGNGGSWAQVDGVAWIQAAGGTIAVENGGSFDMGTAGNMIRDASTVLDIAGDFFYTGNLVYKPIESGAINLLSGANLQISSEFKPLDLFTIPSGASMTTSGLVSFSDGPGIIELSGGMLEIQNGGAFGGFYGPGEDRYVDFTSTASGVIIGGTEEANVIAQVNNGGFRYFGAVDPDAFSVTDLGSGTFLVEAGGLAAIPEPSAFILLASLLAVASLVTRRR